MDFKKLDIANKINQINNISQGDGHAQDYSINQEGYKSVMTNGNRGSIISLIKLFPMGNN